MGKPEHVETPDSSRPVRKPSRMSQIVPYLFTAAILVYVFSGLSSNVVGEKHVLSVKGWSTLEGAGVRPESVEVRSPDGSFSYCGTPEGGGEVAPACEGGPDYALRVHEEGGRVSLRRLEPSRIPSHGRVAVHYVKKVSLPEIWAMVRQADLRLFVPVMALHALVFFLADVLSFGMAYRWFNAPDITWRERMEVRGAPYVIQIGLAPLAEALFPLYMWRVKRVPVSETVSSNIWAMILDFAAIATAITPAVLYNLFVRNLVPAVGTGWLVGCAIFWALFFGMLAFWRSPAGRRAAARIAAGRETGGARDGLRGALGGGLQLLRTFGIARWHHILPVYGARLLLLASSLVSSYVAMRAFGMEPSAPMALIGIPLIVLSIFMPVGVGGYGGPQLIAWFLFVKVGEAGTADQVIAYSLLWSTAFLLGRAAVGLVFIRGFWTRCFPRGFNL